MGLAWMSQPENQESYNSCSNEVINMWINKENNTYVFIILLP